MEEPQPLPRILSPCSSGRRISTDANSPEFEFWMVRNPSFPQHNLLSADELFSDGFLLPLHLLQPSNHEPPPIPPPPQEDREKTPAPEQEPSPIIDCTLTPSKRWSYIFKKSDKKGLESDDHPITKEKKRDQKKNAGVGGGSAGGGVGGASSSRVSAAELNINIWPFSRSRSAGNGGTRPRPAAATRKVSSAPCSRSNSTGESKSKKWPPNSPSRAAGVHLGRSSPVWKARRGGGGAAGGGIKDGNEGRRKLPPASKARVLSLNVPMCIGYRHHLSCTSDENSAVSVAASAAGVGGGGGGDSRIGGVIGGEGVRRSNLFNIRSLFTKKVY